MYLKLPFENLESFSPREFLGRSNSRRYHRVFKFVIITQKSEVCVCLFYFFSFERNCDVLKSKSPCFLAEEKYKFFIGHGIENVKAFGRNICM